MASWGCIDKGWGIPGTLGPTPPTPLGHAHCFGVIQSIPRQLPCMVCSCLICKELFVHWKCIWKKPLFLQMVEMLVKHFFHKEQLLPGAVREACVLASAWRIIPLGQPTMHLQHRKHVCYMWCVDENPWGCYCRKLEGPLLVKWRYSTHSNFKVSAGNFGRMCDTKL